MNDMNDTEGSVSGKFTRRDSFDVSVVLIFSCTHCHAMYIDILFDKITSLVTS